MILILTSPDDHAADPVEQTLLRRGFDVARFDASRFPASAALSVSYAPTGRRQTVARWDDTILDLADVDAVWLRSLGPVSAHAGIADDRARDVASRESRAVLLDALHALSCRWLPAPPDVVRDAQRKLSQLSLAGEIGFELPPTLVTTSPDDLLAFYREHGGNIISKLADLAFHQELGREFARYTEVVTRRDIAHVDAVRHCPMIYQAYVPKRVELRVTVVGGEVFPAEIRSQQRNHTRHDWRRYDDLTTPYARHDLPDDVAAMCVALTARLDLCYGAIDFVLTPDGRYVFLEINPAGQFLWIEHATGLPISDAICDALAAGTGAAVPVPSFSDTHEGGVL